MQESPNDFIGSARDVREGMGTKFFNWMMEELKVWLYAIRDELEDPGNVYDDKTLHRLGGNAETLRRVLALPDVLIASIEANNERSKRKEEVEDE